MSGDQPVSLSPLPPERLFTRCDPHSLPFQSTAELADADDAIGQERAMEAISFAMGMRHRGFNLFALGAEGTGRRSLVMRLLSRQATERPAPGDWVYINDFEQNQRPKALSLPAGRAILLKKDMDWLIGELGQALPAAFEAEEYRNRRQAIEDALKERQEQAFGAIAHDAGKNGVALVRTPVGLALAPMKDTEVLSPEQFKQLPDDQQDRFKTDMAALQEKLEATLKLVPKWERESRASLRALDHDVVAFAIEHLLDELIAKYSDLPAVLTYLTAVAADVAANVTDFLGDDDRSAKVRRSLGGDAFRRYRVNVLVDNDQTQGAPVVYEDYPTQPNLIGRIEHLAQFGALITDFNLIRAGSLHKANGGFLVMDARKLLMNPFAWEDLKRALKVREVRIESPGQSMGILSTFSLEPAPIALDLKVVLIGDPMLYYQLSHHDPEFSELFKVAADFDWRMDRSPQAVLELARSVATLTRKEGLLPLDQGAMARVVEQASRLVEDAEKLSTHMASLADLVREADHWAMQDKVGIIGAGHVQRAIDASIRRQDRVRDNVQEEIRRGIIHVATSGSETGQINALAVLELGNFAFGHPARITARIHAGKGDVIDIEREIDLGGPLHGKGVLILSGFLAARFGETEPLSVSASLVFEQSYGGVDGDSASSAELYVLLSALSGVPIRQDLAVTGSVDQFGRIQAIGGVNEKIEGFFDLCVSRGLSGSQGVLIPASNSAHLMLRADVVEACRQGRFAIYPVEHVDQGIEVLTGVPAGEADENGRYPVGSVNRKIQARLAAFLHRPERLLDRDKKPELD
ncbi:Lon protease family protein [Magnetospirillum sulfuroxidans]|uniref:endopeptidase La n=1 Tax=Magnetospirillum sulfuroxidans TaxID=611300 RepID=A0ABS5IA21_9PROT|nr:AAA family ATPase [Magnetospirillum sulfuroxidans]MBR9971250.1 AAA family ATPase [Magnetospirillum sulfuroxidans]